MLILTFIYRVVNFLYYHFTVNTTIACFITAVLISLVMPLISALYYEVGSISGALMLSFPLIAPIRFFDWTTWGATPELQNNVNANFREFGGIFADLCVTPDMYPYIFTNPADFTVTPVQNAMHQVLEGELLRHKLVKVGAGPAPTLAPKGAMGLIETGLPQFDTATFFAYSFTDEMLEGMLYLALVAV